MALLIFSTVKAYQIQTSLSAEAVEIYRRHGKQDDILYRLRRTLWLGSVYARDLMIDPAEGREKRFRDQVTSLQADSKKLLRELDEQSISGRPSEAIAASFEDFWKTLEDIPARMPILSRGERFEFIQTEIVPRRNAAGDLVREFAAVSQDVLNDTETDLIRTRRSSAQRLLIILGLSVIAGFAVAVVSLVYSEGLERQTARHYEEVLRAKTELQQLSARLMEIQEEERTRLSRELHDEIGQTMATLRLEIARAESAAASRAPAIGDRLRRAGELAESTVQTVRNISVLLRPSLLDDLGLVPALQWQAEDFTRRTGVPCEIVDQDVGDALSEAVRTCVYRVVQESLHNCEKHAAASLVQVSLVQTADELVLRVEDNGCGFAVDARAGAGRPGRLGILGMRERATGVGGVLDLESKPGEGTRLRLRIPLHRADSSAEGESAAREAHV